MINILETITAFLLAGVLIFNMSQRRYLAGGEKKRFASLYLAGVLLAVYLGFLALKQQALPASFIYPVLAAGLLLLLALRKKIFIFRTACRDCGLRYPLKEILYADAPVCPRCSVLEKKSASGSPESVEEMDWETWKPDEKAVIVYITDRETGRVLLIHKKRGLGAGKVNAPGGRLDPGETFLEAAVRECREEVGVTPLNLEKRAELYFQFTNGYSLYGEAFFTDSWEGTPGESDEADPFWCPLTEIPWEKMWADDIHWLPGSLEGRFFRGRYIFDDDDMLSQDLTEWDREFQNPRS